MPGRTRLHNRLVVPARSVLVLVDPRRRVIEVVTGGEVRRHLTDAEVELAVLEMASDFAAGNMLGRSPARHRHARRARAAADDPPRLSVDSALMPLKRDESAPCPPTRA